ncbi:hypothetical protein [Methanococcoides seepicolus]|jgi:hypothetical protein|uniref:Uncharacterized protein n=1 Tax=Methanococcoides seepicolus TaxID=2828780 RepID=A0A9E4ZEX4_9EURY|nr:hypothetical protein [Methanococcoides seepicolus]MCM1986826.1 hypothetical protein [Methanococcoides seepicolus]
MFDSTARSSTLAAEQMDAVPGHQLSYRSFYSYHTIQYITNLLLVGTATKRRSALSVMVAPFLPRTLQGIKGEQLSGAQIEV